MLSLCRFSIHADTRRHGPRAPRPAPRAPAPQPQHPQSASKHLDLPPDLKVLLPPLDRLSLVLIVLPTGEAYLHLELVLLVEVGAQPGDGTPQNQRLWPALTAAAQPPAGPRAARLPIPSAWCSLVPGEPAPRGQGGELWRYQDGPFQDAGSAARWSAPSCRTRRRACGSPPCAAAAGASASHHAERTCLWSCACRANGGGNDGFGGGTLEQLRRRLGARSPLLGVLSRPEPPSRCAPGRRRSRARARPEEAFDIAGAHCNVHVVQPALAVAHLAVAITCDAANRRRVRSTGAAAACWACSSPWPSAAALITRCCT